MKGIDQVAPLRALEKGWDSYGADRITEDAILSAGELIDILQAQGLAPPNVIPTRCGGILLEWQNPSIEIDIHMRGFIEGVLFGDSKNLSLEM